MGKASKTQRPNRDTLTQLQSWDQTEELLQGLLSIQIDEPFTDLDHLCPQRAWLVLHVDLVRPLTQLHSVLDALAVLCVRSERLDEQHHLAFWQHVLTSTTLMRTSSDLQSATAPSLLKFVRFVRHKGIHVLLSWQDKRWQSSVATQLHAFLNAPLAKYDTAADAMDGTVAMRPWRLWRPLGLGLQFKNCSMNRNDLVGLKSLLTDSLEEEKTNDGAPRLCEQRTLHRLDLDGNRMGVAELRVLTSLLEDPSCRRIDDLDLQRTFPDNNGTSTTTTEYIAAFRRVMAAALTAKTAKTSTLVRADPGIALSLAHNTLAADGSHLHALYDALATATRKLRGLSLAYTKSSKSSGSDPKEGKDEANPWFSRICMTSPVTSFTQDCVLDITLADALVAPVHDMDVFHKPLADLIVASVPVIRAALLANERVLCRARWTELFERTWRGVSEYEYVGVHKVLRVRDDGSCLVHHTYEDKEEEEESENEEEEEDREDEVYDDEEEEEEEEEAGDDEDYEPANSCWVDPKHITALYTAIPSDPSPSPTSTSTSSCTTGLRDLLRMRFRAIIANGDNDAFGRILAPKSTFLTFFLGTVGSEIHRLSLRRWHDLQTTLPTVLSLCPKLQEIDTQSSRLVDDDPVRWLGWYGLHNHRRKHLQVINVSGANVDVQFFERLLQRAHKVTTRSLSLLDCALDFNQLSLLQRILATNKTLEMVELDARVVPSGPNDATSPTKLAMAITRAHNHEQLHSTPLATDRKVAFASVLPKLPLLQDADIDAVVLQHCLEFAGNVAVRRIVWCDHVALRRWFVPRRSEKTPPVA